MDEIQNIVEFAKNEWRFFGKQEIDSDGEMIRRGKRETDDGFWERVGVYWDYNKDRDLTGLDTDQAWSAAFISYIMKKAGLGTSFLYADAHCSYINKAIKLVPDTDSEFAFRGRKLAEYKPKIGDLICYSREKNVSYDNHPSWYKSHADIVVDIVGNEILVIGGNVQDSVSLKHLKLDSHGYLIDKQFEWFVILENRIGDIASSSEQPNYLVTANGLRVRKEPNLDSEINGAVHKGDIVKFFGFSDDKEWLLIEKDGLQGWSNYKFLKDISSAGVPDCYSEIIDIVNSSSIITYRWKDRGAAPLGYYKGMALVFARVYCKLKEGDEAAKEMAKANTGNAEKDALAYYANEFKAIGLVNEADGVGTLRHLFVLMFGLGMRESSGQHCVGVDKSSNDFKSGTVSADTAEAGLFQTSYNAMRMSTLLRTIYDSYKDNPQGFLEAFSEGKMRCTVTDAQNFGTGEGVTFQNLSKTCPAFAAEFAAVALRNGRKHWGPINNKKVELKAECNTMLLKIQAVVDRYGIISI